MKMKIIAILLTSKYYLFIGKHYKIIFQNIAPIFTFYLVKEKNPNQNISLICRKTYLNHIKPCTSFSLNYS